jgi:hypothetical protein
MASGYWLGPKSANILRDVNQSDSHRSRIDVLDSLSRSDSLVIELDLQGI